MDSTVRILTFSGAHCTGKTTLVEAVHAALIARHGGPVAEIVPSISSAVFERVRARVLTFRTGAVPTTFDEIDEMGLRQEFQLMLASQLLDSVLSVWDILAGRGGFLIVDRWFPDILAYSRQLSGPADQFEVQSACHAARMRMTSRLQLRLDSTDMTHFVLRVEDSHFPGADQEGKFRASTSREDFERHLLDGWSLVEHVRSPTVIPFTDLHQRVDFVLSHFPMT